MELGKSTGTNDDDELKNLKMPKLNAQKPPLAPKKRRKLRQVVPVMYIDDKWWDKGLRMTDPFDVHMTDEFDD